jgi:hypothetical protein
MTGNKQKVDAVNAHRFLTGLLENHRCTFDQLPPWIRNHRVKNQRRVLSSDQPTFRCSHPVNPRHPVPG